MEVKEDGRAASYIMIFFMDITSNEECEVLPVGKRETGNFDLTKAIWEKGNR